MQRVMRHLDRRMKEYSAAPFLAYLRDPGVAPLQKLAFAPHVAHFVLTFGDLCAFILRQDPPSDRFQELVNATAREDEGHWRWFLTDLEHVGQDPLLRFSEAIRVIWGDGTVRTRMLSYQLCHFALGADSIGKLVLVHCIEGAFSVTVKDLAIAAADFAAFTGKPLRYLGGVHSDAEASHTIAEAGVRRAIEEVQLDAGVVQSLCAMVDGAFDLFAGFADEMLTLATSATVKLEHRPTTAERDSAPPA